jgi:hypothetical protein
MYCIDDNWQFADFIQQNAKIPKRTVNFYTIIPVKIVTKSKNISRKNQLNQRKLILKSKLVQFHA